MVKGPWGSSELGELGDGYKATITWVLDLLAWWFLRAGGWRLKKIKGIVIVDEIEQHLHPRWQRSIIPMLKKHFSGVQFILSTHSPLCAGSITAFTEKDFQITRLKRLKRSVRAEQVILERGLRADQILTSEAFSLIETRLIYLDPKIKRYNELAIRKKLRPEYRTELEALRNELNTEIPYIGESERDKEIYANLKKHIDKLT